MAVVADNSKSVAGALILLLVCGRLLMGPHVFAVLDANGIVGLLPCEELCAEGVHFCFNLIVWHTLLCQLVLKLCALELHFAALVVLENALIWCFC